jgi:hypothetical protein
MKAPCIGFLLAVAACGTDDPAPSVEVRQATPTELTPADDAADDLRIDIRYADADGDLGEGVARVHDCRARALVTELPIPAIAPEQVIDDGRMIQGALALSINDVGAGAAETLPDVCDDLGVPALGAGETVFCVVLVDAKAHEGPGDCTQTITLTAN